MSFETGFPLLFIFWVTVQDAVVTDDAAIYFVEPDLVTILHGVQFLATADDVRVRLKDTHEFLTSRHLLLFEHAADGLINHLLAARDESGQALRQTFGALALRVLKLFQHLSSPFHRFSGHPEQFL